MNRRARVIRPFQKPALVLQFWSYRLNHFSVYRETLRHLCKKVLSSSLENFICYIILCSESQNTNFFSICTLSAALFLL